MLNMLKIAAVVVCAGLIFLYDPTQALAWGGRDRDGGHQNYPHSRSYPYGRLTVEMSHGAISFGSGSGRYYYDSGLFYRPYQREYIVVPPLSGAVVYQIPAQYNQVVIDGVVYYTYNGVYYTRVAQGFQVIQPPAVVGDAATVSASAAPDEEEIFTVNILLAKGGYKAVIIKRDGAGFQGPQGEFYPEFPKVEQLKVMYGDKVK
jgi:hypothetical protein